MSWLHEFQTSNTIRSFNSLHCGIFLEIFKRTVDFFCEMHIMCLATVRVLNNNLGGRSLIIEELLKFIATR